MKYLLDANAVIATLKGEPTMLERLRAHLLSDFGLPRVTLSPSGNPLPPFQPTISVVPDGPSPLS